MSAPNPILLNPGPVVLSEPVRKALSRPDLCHREAEFSALQNKLRAGLLAVYIRGQKEPFGVCGTVKEMADVLKRAEMLKTTASNDEQT